LWRRRYIYGQASSKSASCSASRTYLIDVALAATAVSFEDDYCGALTLGDTLGASEALFVYVGADNDAGAARWDDIRMWGLPTWGECTPMPVR
jgi:hypothetical protein